MSGPPLAMAAAFGAPVTGPTHRVGPDEALSIVRAGLNAAMEVVAADGMAAIPIRGQLIRPLLAFGAAGGERGSVPAAFWEAALAVQLAHEASLIHDDIIDGSATRRGEATLMASRGVAAALVQGDHLLTTAYRLASRTGSPVFVELFARAVERTVAGEIAQGRSIGRRLEWEEYRSIAIGKSGELLGCALAAAIALERPTLVPRAFELGRRIGLLYQMLDDLLDYCPQVDTGKPGLGDFAQARWTWPLLHLPEIGFDDDPARVADHFSTPAAGGSALRRCLHRLESDARELVIEAESCFGPVPVITEVLDGWLARGRGALRSEERTGALGFEPKESGPSAALLRRAPRSGEIVDYFARNSRTFRFASRFFPPAELDLVAHVYAYCRTMDDLVDDPDGADPETLLGEWVELSRIAYGGGRTGIDFLDRVMWDMGGAGVSFDYAAELAEGMRMDLRGERYATLAELRRYSYRVASVVGLWITELAGVRDRAALKRAEALGHAMQLTNILRDVGEDARRGRIYLPADRMAAHGVTATDLCTMCDPDAAITPGYRALVEELIGVAENDYRLAFEAVPMLPPVFHRPVAVAAHLYRGIHDEIRIRCYDNMRQRAVTSGGTKARLAVRALWDLHTVSRRGTLVPHVPRPRFDIIRRSV